jgi:hypothetical protein
MQLDTVNRRLAVYNRELIEMLRHYVHFVVRKLFKKNNPKTKTVV